LIEDDNLTPEEKRASKIAFATEEPRKIVEKRALIAGEKGKMETAQNMIAKGFDVQTISEITGLDVETLNQFGQDQYF
jgi:predicted transposase/invertase (TIGR01784 family)